MAGKTRKKENFPEKICEACRKPFSWRKKWERVWDSVRYCSDRCKRGPETPRNG